MSAKKRILVYIIGCFIFSILAGVFINVNIEAGGLLFIIGPVLFSVVLNFQSKKKQAFSFLKLSFNGNIRWYLFSILVYPLALLFSIGSGSLFDIATLHPENFTLLLRTISIQFVPRMIFAFFEEMGWRGFLELEFKRIGITSFKRHFYIGVIWALWHLPFIFTTSYTTVPYFIFIPTFILGVIILSFIYGYLLEKTNSIWAGVLFHGISNTLAWSFINSNFTLFSKPVLVNISPECIVGLLFFGSIVVYLYLRTIPKKIISYHKVIFFSTLIYNFAL